MPSSSFYPPMLSLGGTDAGSVAARGAAARVRSGLARGRADCCVHGLRAPVTAQPCCRESLAP